MFNKIYLQLLKNYGEQGWWPLSKGSLKTQHHNGNPVSDKDRFEIIVGAILTQNTSWKNVEKALYNLNKNKLLDAKKLAVARIDKIARLIKPAGYYNLKAERLKIIARHYIQHSSLLNKNVKELRAELLSIKGIGPETADSIILYAAEKPSFVIDAYTKRIFSRLGFCKEDVAYDELKTIFEKNLKPDTKMFKEYHALIVEHAKRFCNKRPKCSGCILRRFCNFNPKC